MFARSICTIRPLVAARAGVPTTPCRAFAAATASSSAPASEKVQPKGPVQIHSAKKNIAQSPWKMNFLVKLARGRWLPDALAQMKFSPKGRSEEVAKILQRGADIAKIYHSVMPEELVVKEIMVTKGAAHKRMRIMGRGRTGFGYRRATHVSTTLEVVDFEALVAAAKTSEQRRLWKKRHELVLSLKKALPDAAAPAEAGAVAPAA